MCPVFFLLETFKRVVCGRLFLLRMFHGIYSSTYGGHLTVASLVLLT